jgi:hypothetical protein
MSVGIHNTNNCLSSALALALYVIFFHLFQIMLQYLLLLDGLQLLFSKTMFLAICLDLLFIYLLVCMISLFSIKLVMFYLLLL